MRVGCYICPRCPEGERWFRLEPPGFEGWRNYTTSSMLGVLSLVTVHKLSFTGAAAVGRSLLHLPELADTTVLRWYREAGDQVDYRGHLARMAEVFSGQLALDEVYDGGFYVIKATDPLNNLELTAWIGEGSPTAEDVREVLLELREAGIWPQLVVTDASSLYPRVIQEVWPEAEHQLCVFHFIMGVNKKLAQVFWAAYKTMPEPKKRKRGRPKKRGRPRLDKLKRANRRKVKAVRYLLFKRGGVDGQGKVRITENEQRHLDEALRLCPALAHLRRFIETLYELFGPTTDSHVLAEERRQAILEDAEFIELSGLAPVLDNLRDEELFNRLTRHLSFENADKTSNHVERENRELRKRQRSHYRLRSIRSLCAFLDLLLVRRDLPDQPRRLRRRERRTEVDPGREEVLAA
ncbi:MAG: transposase [Proteobacteria bacterium]|nr:transposase [Pseudomonadota bacterium]